MNTRKRTRTNGHARLIKTRRDYQGASAVFRRLSAQTGLPSADELRLQSLLKEMDRFEDLEDDTSLDVAEDENYTGPRRRWSDDPSDDD